MVILQKFSSAVLRSLRFLSAILGVVIGNIALILYLVSIQSGFGYHSGHIATFWDAGF